MSKFTIALAQFHIAQFQPELNLQKAERLIAKAAKQADLIVFPEDFITGPILRRPEMADAQDKYVNIFRTWAKHYSIDIVPGSIIINASGKLHNRSYYIDRNGKILARYDKINLWHPERSKFECGNKVSVFHTRFGRVGLVICWDLISTEIFRVMAANKVQMVICPSYWCYNDSYPANRFNHNAEIVCVDSLCTARACENNILMIYCNAAGYAQIGKWHDNLIGHSQVCAPILGPIAKVSNNKEKLIYADLDLSILKESESVYKIRRDHRQKYINIANTK